MKKHGTRVEKWMKYRESILENQNIRESLINTNKDFNQQYKKLSTIFHNVDFLNNKQEEFLSKIDSIDLGTQEQITEINKHLSEVNEIERKRTSEKNEEKKYNSNTYDKFIKDYFPNEYNKQEETDKIKVTKIALRK